MNELVLFDFLKLNLYPDLERAPGIYDAFDCTSAKAGHFIELKCRQTHYSTLLIEQMKYRKLITQAAERDRRLGGRDPPGQLTLDRQQIIENKQALHG